MPLICDESIHQSSDSTVHSITDEIVTPTPFNLERVFGFNPDVPVISLGKNDCSLVAYASSNITVLYDYSSREMFTLQGHTDFVRALSVDQTEKWLLTADYCENCTVVVWDLTNRSPIYTLQNPHEKNHLTTAALSINAKYVITVGNENIQVVKLWFWTLGRKNHEASIELTETKEDQVKEICFSYENSNLFALTTNRRVIFITWNPNSENLSTKCPTINSGSKDFGIFNNTTFIYNSSKAFTGTTNGYVLIWNYVSEKDVSEGRELKCIKSIQLQKSNITKVVNYKGLVVTGNSRGHVNFYDCNLKILYWCRNCGLDSITSISFGLLTQFTNVENPCIDNDMGSLIKEWLLKNTCKENYDEVEKMKDESLNDEISSNVTRKLESLPKIRECINKPFDNQTLMFAEKLYKFEVPREATLESNEFCTDKFIVTTTSGKLMWIDISKMSSRLISHYFDSSLTALDIHPQSDQLVIADENGTLFLFNYREGRMIFQTYMPIVPNLTSILKNEVSNQRIIHVTNLEINPKDKSYPTVLKYSPSGMILTCALNNGIMWLLRPDTLDSLDPLPYKHSSHPILEVIFSEDSRFMAYFDSSMTVAAFKCNEKCQPSNCYYDFIGKYRSHYLPIVSILFGPISNSRQTSRYENDEVFPRFLSLGKDRDLVEYNLRKSGPYPHPGLVILEIHRIKQAEIPLSMNWYPQMTERQYLIISNTDYKFKLIDSLTKEICTTVLGPTFSSCVKKTMICRDIDQVQKGDHSVYLLFATNKEIGLQLLPLDGNPYKITGILGHPRKISCMRLSSYGQFLFTLGRNDRSISMWTVNFKSANILHRLGGTGLTPYYGLINGGKFGWLFTEMKALFVYAQILEEGEDYMEARRIGDEIAVELLPNIMRSIGFYPSNDQIKDLIIEVTRENVESSGKTRTRINFEKFVKLYVNHRPAFGILKNHLENAFLTLAKLEKSEDESLSKELLVAVLSKRISSSDDSFGRCETLKNLRSLILQKFKEDAVEVKAKNENSLMEEVLNALPRRISYKDFTTDIMGIESPKETRADNDDKSFRTS